MLIIRAIPYLVALILSVGDVPSRLLARRHRRHISAVQIEFASRWNAVAEALGYPFLVLFYSLSQVGDLFRHQPTIVISAWLMTGGLIYATLVFVSWWLFGTDLDEPLPSFRIGRVALNFDKLVVLTKSTGILFPALLDLWLTSRSLVAADCG